MKKKLYIISLITFLIIGTTLFLIGGYFAGWDFKAWFVSPTAMWAYILLFLYVMAIVFIEGREKIKKL